MIERFVLRARTDADGELTALVGPDEPWSPRLVADAAADILDGRVRYLVPWPGGTVSIAVTDGARLEAPGPDGEPGGLRRLPSG